MKHFKLYLQKKYQLSNYQIAQISFLFKTIASEISKMLIMSILFYNKLTHYIFALLIMILLRSTLGGLHFYTYIGCLLTSALYLWLTVYILPHITITTFFQLVLLILCILLCNHIGPITSKYRPSECKKIFLQCKRFACGFIFFYALILYIIPKNQYFDIGFWVIILHSLQLTVAKIIKKGGFTI